MSGLIKQKSSEYATCGATLVESAILSLMISVFVFSFVNVFADNFGHMNSPIVSAMTGTYGGGTAGSSTIECQTEHIECERMRTNPNSGNRHSNRKP